jgi:REP element-mobilizing transposase RayT
MPHVKVWIHFVWSTKNHAPLLTAEIRPQVFQHIRENAKEKDIFVDFINGYVGHTHALVSLGTDQTISQIMQLLKGESSFWINKNKLCSGKFEWQGEYFAASVSESVVGSVRNYIKKQEQHHRHKTFAEEYEEFIMKAGFQKFG